MAKILVIDDRPTNRELLTTLLGYFGHHLLEASDGAQALDVVRAERPDLVIADIVMPTMDGYEFVRQLRADPAIASSRVIFCTAVYHEKKARDLAHAWGVSHVLIRPSEPEVILRTVDAALSLDISSPPSLCPEDFDREHLRLLTDKLSQKVDELEQEVTELKRAKSALRAAHDHLEVRVQERTRDLAKANEELLREIRDRKQAEAALQEQRILGEMRNCELNAARAAAEEANRLKSDFLSSCSHELRTPLTSTLNYLTLLEQGFYDNPQELQEYIKVAYESAQDLVAIINDVLDIAKIEAGQMHVNLESVSLPSLLKRKRKLFSLESRNKGIPLIIECSVDSVFADKLKLRQILTNLLSNAFKFTSTGSVRLRARLREVSSPTASDHPLVEISVADTGIGIDNSKRDLLFEPFVQADGSIERRYGGTGLGLTICQRLVELMGGNIWLDSPGIGQGTTVTFTLPYKKIEEQEHTLKTQSATAI